MIVSFRIRAFLIIAGVFILGYFAGVFGMFSLFQRIQKLSGPASLPKIPLSKNYLVNSVMRNLYANAEGVIVVKSENSFTLEQDGNRATIFIYLPESAELTVFWDETARKRVDFAQVKVGDYLRGGISVVMEPDDWHSQIILKAGDLIAQRFSILKRAAP